MKTIILLQTLLFTFLGIQFNILPQLPPLLFAVVGVMALDLITGIIKAKLKNEVRTSKAMRSSVIKFAQYFTAIIIAVGLQYLFKNIDAESLQNVKYITRGLCLFIVLIEIFSVCENIYEVDKTSPFSKYLVKPILSILSFGIKNNPLTDAAKQAAEKNNDKENESN